MRISIIALIAFGFFSSNTNAQSKISVHLNTGLHVPLNDFTDNTFQGVRPNTFVAGGLGYVLADKFRLRGDLSMGILNGDNNVNFYETSLIETALFAEYDILPYIVLSKKLEFYINGGTGLVAYQTKLFDIATRNRITESPVPGTSSYSINPILSGGFNAVYALTPNLAINVGYTQKLTLFNDYMDGFKNGSGNDYYGSLNVGMIATFKKVRDKSKVEINKKKYNNLISTIDSLDGAAKRGNPEKMAKLEMESQEKDLKIRSLEMKIDSMETRVVAIDTENPRTKSSPNAEAILATPQYRIIVGSMPSRERATKWINKSSLDQSEMVVLYVDDIDTYRIIYKSYSTYAAAKKDLPSVKSVVADAWIIKL